MNKILFIQHTNVISGSAMSLLYTVKNLNQDKYNPTIALVRTADELLNLYLKEGIETFYASGIHLYEHSTGGWFGYNNPIDYWKRARQALGISASLKGTDELVNKVRPDLVHLNSVTLLPCAKALFKMGVPFVWHVRESPVRGLLGFRLSWIRKNLIALPNGLIFLSSYDKQGWTGRNDVGEVIPNFISFSVFDCNISREGARKKLGLDGETPVILYLGGFSRIKGIEALVPAIGLLKTRFPDIQCLMPGSLYGPPTSFMLKAARKLLPLVGTGTFYQRINTLIDKLNINNNIVYLPSDPIIAPYYAAADVVVFPSIEPHFARPVIEAGAMAKPVVATRLGCIEELVHDGETGLLVEPNNFRALADALGNILRDKYLGRQMGERGFSLAKERYSVETNIPKIENKYTNILG